MPVNLLIVGARSGGERLGCLPGVAQVLPPNLSMLEDHLKLWGLSKCVKRNLSATFPALWHKQVDFDLSAVAFDERVFHGTASY